MLHTEWGRTGQAPQHQTTGAGHDIKLRIFFFKREHMSSARINDSFAYLRGHCVSLVNICASAIWLVAGVQTYD